MRPVLLSSLIDAPAEELALEWLYLDQAATRPLPTSTRQSGHRKVFSGSHGEHWRPGSSAQMGPVSWSVAAAIPGRGHANTKGHHVVGKQIVTVLPGAALALPVIAYSSGGVAEAATSGQAPAPGVAAGQATVAYDWGKVRCHSRGLGGLASKNGTRKKRNGFCDDPDPTVVAGVKGTITSIATSNSDSYALTSSGSVYAWGHGSQGELGNGTHPVSQATAVRVHFPAGVKIARLPNPMPYNGGMAISTTGTVYAWGNDSRHQFCQSGSGNILTPVAVPLPHVTLAAGALLHTIYDSNGTVYSCGAGMKGQLGNGTSGPAADTSTPVRVSGLPTGQVKALTSAWGNAGVLMASGSYYDWGYNQAGQVGDGTKEMATRAVQVKLPAVSLVSEGGSLPGNGQTIALASDGRVYVWGNGQQGQLGNGSTSNALKPQLLKAPSGVHFAQVNSGGATDYAVTSSGGLYAWGSNAKDQIGNGVSGAQHPRYTRPVSDHLTVAQVSSTASDVAAFAIG
jgi:alpha-tubulin suppressor-like RCC1 family protein